MSLEIIYHHGGFWVNENMNLLRPIFDRFRDYKFVVGAGPTSQYRWSQPFSFFGAAPKFNNILKLVNFNSLNRISIASNLDFLKAEFSRLLSQEEEYSEEVLLLPHEAIYPAGTSERGLTDLCKRSEEDWKEGENFDLAQNGFLFLSRCSFIYPYAYAVEHSIMSRTSQKNVGVKAKIN